MRLKERNLQNVRIVARSCEAGALGGLAEGFKGEGVHLRASILPEEAELNREKKGAAYHERLRLLVPGDAVVHPGDGVWLEDALYRVCGVQAWTAHKELICEAI